MSEKRSGMNWLSNLARPGMKKREDTRAVETPDNLWIKCPTSGELVFRADLEAARWVTPAGFHMRIGPDIRFKHLFDEAAYQAIALPAVPLDPLRFKDDKKYIDRLKAARAKVGREDCMAAAHGAIGGAPAVVIVQDFEFMGGSLGMGAGEAFITAAREAIKRGAALICVAASGGARMQEGILSLMQMTRTTLAVEEVREAGLPYIVVLTDPTTGGVTASYAMLGDIQIAEPGALIGFTGPRVIEQTIRQKLPEGFQRSEFQLEKGMVDAVIDRRELTETLGVVLNILMANRLARANEQPPLPLREVEPKRPAARPKARAAE
jgi:acetyl-CoA carboxylase carboxyl transferase subunit beta